MYNTVCEQMNAVEMNIQVEKKVGTRTRPPAMANLFRQNSEHGVYTAHTHTHTPSVKPNENVRYVQIIMWIFVM